MAQSSLCPPLVLLAGVQTDSTGELALEHRALGREHQKKRGKKENICSVVGRGQRKPSGHLFNFLCFCPRCPPAIFLVPQSSSWKKEHKQPYSKINTAILCVFTFHSVISVILCPRLLCSISRREEELLFLGPLYR